MIGHFSSKATQNSATHTKHSWRVDMFHIFTSRMPCYAIWVTFVFLQASVPRWFGKHTTVELLGISGSRKWWQYCKSISISQIFNRMSGSTSDHALPAPLPNWPSRSKASIPRCLPLVKLGNPSPWITCHVFHPISMEMTVFLWSSTGSRRWPLWPSARRISQQKPLLNFFFEWVWVHFRIPQSIILDRDNRFLSTFWSSLWSMLDTKLTKFTPFHPQTDG